MNRQCATYNNTRRLVFKAQLRPQFRTPTVPNAPSSEFPPSFDRCTPVLLVDCCCTLVLHSAFSERIPFDRRGVAGMANLKIYLLRQFCSNRVDFLQYAGDTVAKK